MLVQYNKSTKSVIYNNRILENGYERYLLKFDYIQDIAKKNLIDEKKALLIIEDIKKVLNTFSKRADDIKLDNKKKDGCWMNIKEQLEIL